MNSCNTNQMKGQSLVSFLPIVSFQLPVMNKQLSSTITLIYGQFVKKNTSFNQKLFGQFRLTLYM